MTALAHVLRYPRALVSQADVRVLIDKQCELLRSVQMHPELAACTNLTVNELEQTIAAHQIALRSMKEAA